MIELNFKTKIVIKEEKNYFEEHGIKDINVESGSEIILIGKIKFAKNITFSGKIKISDGVTIGEGCILKNLKIGRNNTIRPYSILENSEFGDNNIIGPFCFVRDNTIVGDNCIVGNQVELSRSVLKNNIKISHQSFMGDVNIENGVIIGAGTVSCNYQGGKRSISNIGSNSIIGSGTMIVSPIKIGQNVIVGAGSVITKNIANNSKLIQKR